MSDLLANLQTQLPFLRGKARLDALNLLANRFNIRDNHQALAFAQEAHILFPIVVFDFLPTIFQNGLQCLNFLK
jgi:hypothetical protein